MVVMRLATRRARHWWWASALRLVGVVSRLAVVVIKVPAMEVGGRGGCGCEGDNGAGADGDGCDGDECVGVGRMASMTAVVLMTLPKLQETTQLKVRI